MEKKADKLEFSGRQNRKIIINFFENRRSVSYFEKNCWESKISFWKINFCKKSTTFACLSSITWYLVATVVSNYFSILYLEVIVSLCKGWFLSELKLMKNGKHRQAQTFCRLRFVPTRCFKKISRSFDFSYLKWKDWQDWTCTNNLCLLVGKLFQIKRMWNAFRIPNNNVSPI